MNFNKRKFSAMVKSLRLEFESTYGFDHQKDGIREPSGLAFAADGSLWTVGDRKRRLFRINKRGQILQRLDVKNRGFEGITIDSKGRLCVVDEDSAKILIYDSRSGEELADRSLKNAQGFNQIKRHFAGDRNNGLEGITFDPTRSEMLLLKEARPGMLIAMNESFDQIKSVLSLDESLGFVTREAKIDFSGLCYDQQRDLLWIVSHQARHVFCFNRQRRIVTDDFPLLIGKKKNRIRQAEGIAIDPAGDRAYIVGDNDEKLFVYRIHSSDSTNY